MNGENCQLKKLFWGWRAKMRLLQSLARPGSLSTEPGAASMLYKCGPNPSSPQKMLQGEDSNSLSVCFVFKNPCLPVMHDT